MRDFIDKISGEVDGTPINRDNLMAVQGFDNIEIVFNEDGSIVETNNKGDVLTTSFNEDGNLVETFVGASGKTITKTTIFEENTIREVLS